MSEKLPPLDFDVGGLSALGEFRLRPTWFGCVLEERWQSQDGSSFWRRATSPVPVPYQGAVRHFWPEGFKFTPTEGFKFTPTDKTEAPPRNPDPPADIGSIVPKNI